MSKRKANDHRRKPIRGSKAGKGVAATFALTPAEQLAFWKALHAPVKLTRAQKQLAKLMRGD